MCHQLYSMYKYKVIYVVTKNSIPVEKHHIVVVICILSPLANLSIVKSVVYVALSN